MANFEKLSLQNKAVNELPAGAALFENEKADSDSDKIHKMRFRGCQIIWHQTKKPPHGLIDYSVEKKGVLSPTEKSFSNTLEIWGKKSGELAWVLATS